MEVTIVGALSHTGGDRRAHKPIDLCIAPLVRALDAGGVRMRASCCGHGKAPAEIALDDGTTIFRLADGIWYQDFPGVPHPADPSRASDHSLMTPSEPIRSILAATLEDR